MLENEAEFVAAFSDLMSGHRQRAAESLKSLYVRTADAQLKVKIVDALLSALDHLKNIDFLSTLCDEAAKNADAIGRPGMRAYFMASKAELLSCRLIFVHHELSCLKMAPCWLEFSTEADRDRHRALTEESDKISAECQRVIEGALSLAERCGDRKILGRVLMSRGNIWSQDYMHKMAEALLGNRRSGWWLRFGSLRGSAIGTYVIFGTSIARKLRDKAALFVGSYLSAAKIFEEAGDDTSGYAYYNLANDLRMMYRFGEATKYLVKASAVAERSGDRKLMSLIEILRKSISSKNRDVPDYINGELRE